MSILREIREWAKQLPAWQQAALTKLFQNPTLTASDDIELYDLLKHAHGGPKPTMQPTPTAPVDQILPPVGPKHPVRLISIATLRNVNAIDSQQTLSFAADGLTVVYGDNGSGKSGYTRVLKKACRARDQSEPILPNATLDPKSVGKASAVLTVDIYGIATSLTWTDEAEQPAELASIGIFDSYCARAYLDKDNDVAYVPYGVDLLTSLSDCCERLAAKLKSEEIANALDLEPIVKRVPADTDAGRLLGSLSAATTDVAVSEAATLDDVAIARLDTLARALSAANPKDNAQRLRLFAARVTRLRTGFVANITLLGDSALQALKSLTDSMQTTRRTADEAAKALNERDGVLPGTGGEAWKTLFLTAQRFSKESLPDLVFPNLPPDALCPLCQQPLTEAGAKLLRVFGDFIANATATAARDAKTKLDTATATLKDASVAIGLDEELQIELGNADKVVAEACRPLDSQLTARRSAMLAASSGKLEWSSIPSISVDVERQLGELSERLTADAVALDAVGNEAQRAMLEIEHKELSARQKLGEMKADILSALEKLRVRALVKRARADVGTATISKKIGQITEDAIAKELHKALNVELSLLGMADLRVSIKQRIEKGRTYNKLVLELPGAVAPSKILSEGEQRAIAIASFLAEVNLLGSGGGIVFDDPVSSLDHRRRELVAMRLARESASRQVIVFTHDLFFMCHLLDAAKELKVPVLAKSLTRVGAVFGVVDSDIPFQGKRTAERVGALRVRQVDCARVKKHGSDAELATIMRTAYTDLRTAWERCIEEVLLFEVVLRFREGVETSRLQSVTVEHDDWRIIDSAMSKCSKYAHDKATIANTVFPSPAEFLTDIDSLEAWRLALIERRNDVRLRRK